MSNTVKIEIDCGNDAFSDDNCGPELARILRRMADELEHMDRDDLANDRCNTTFNDINGNRVAELDLDIEKPFDEDGYRRCLRKADRSDIQNLLEECTGTAVYDDEPTAELIDTVIESLKNEDISDFTLEAYGIDTP